MKNNDKIKLALLGTVVAGISALIGYGVAKYQYDYDFGGDDMDDDFFDDDYDEDDLDDEEEAEDDMY